MIGTVWVIVNSKVIVRMFVIIMLLFGIFLFGCLVVYCSDDNLYKKGDNFEFSNI